MIGFLEQFVILARGRPLVALMLALTVALGIGNYFLWKHRIAADQEHDVIQKRGEIILNALINREQIATDRDKLKVALDAIDDNLVVESDMEVNLGFFYRIEKSTRVRLSQLSQLSAQPPAPGNRYKAIPFSLRATGTYPQLMAFLRELETGPRILAIRTFSFGVGDSRSSAMSLDLSVDILGR